MGQPLYSDEFFQHDIDHAYTIKKIDNFQLATDVRRKIASFLKFQREAIEYVFYDITYEKGYTLSNYMAYRIGITPALGIDKEAIAEAQTTLIKILNDSPYIYTLLIGALIYVFQDTFL